MAVIAAAVPAGRWVDEPDARAAWVAPAGYQQVDQVGGLRLWVRSAGPERCWYVESRAGEAVGACGGTQDQVTVSAVLGELVGVTPHAEAAAVRVDSRPALVHDGVFLAADIRPPGAAEVRVDELDRAGRELGVHRVAVP